jgi:MFS family permease
LLERWGYEDAPLRVAAITVTLACIAGIAGTLQSDPILALALIGAASFFVTMPLALVTVALQTVTPNEMRGLIAGLVVVMNNVVGLALGPTIVALFTDHLFKDPLAVGKSLALTFALVAPIAVVLLISGMRPYRETIHMIDRE